MKFLNQFLLQSLQGLGALFMSLALVACGGGGSAGAPVVGGGGGSGGTTAPAISVGMSLSSITVTVGSPATLTVQVRDRAGNGVANQLVLFSTQLNLGSFSAPSALTDASGNASVQLKPINGNATGADIAKATVEVAGTEFTGSIGFQTTATDVAIASFTSDDADGVIGPYGTAALTVQLTGTNPATPVNLVMGSACVSNGKATLTPASTATSTGRAVFTYRDSGCGAIAGTDQIQVTVTGTSLVSTLSLGLSRPTPASIAFVSSSPQVIYLKGSGFVENSNVKFKVNDANGNGMPEVDVNLELSTLAGGVLIDGGTAAVVKRTDSSGEVIVRINAGTVPTPVRVKANLVGSDINTVSSALSVAVGLPSQLNFSLSQRTINLEGGSIDGTENFYYVIASDRMGNPVPDGTAINFVTEGGQVQASALTTVLNGVSKTEARFLSAEPRPLDGRITVVAYALGEESFLDVNGDNIYNLGEDYQDLGDVFVDRLFNFGRLTGTPPRFDASVGYTQATDQFVSLGLSGSAVCRIPGNALLDLRTDIPVRPGSCNEGWGRAYVRRATETVLSGSAMQAYWPIPNTLPSNAIAPSIDQCPQLVSKIWDYAHDDTPNLRSFYPVSGTTLLLPADDLVVIMVADDNPIAFNPLPQGTVFTPFSTGAVGVQIAGGSPVVNTARPTNVLVSIASSGTIDGAATITAKTAGGLSTAVAFGIKKSMPAGWVNCN